MADDDGSEEAETGLTAEALPPAFMGPVDFSPTQFRRLMQEAVKGWLLRTPSEATQAAYKSDLDEFLRFVLSREGQQVVLEHASYVPLRANQVQSSRALLDR